MLLLGLAACLHVIPVQAGIQSLSQLHWMLAFEGVTGKGMQNPLNPRPHTSECQAQKRAIMSAPRPTNTH